MFYKSKLIEELQQENESLRSEVKYLEKWSDDLLKSLEHETKTDINKNSKVTDEVKILKEKLADAEQKRNLAEQSCRQCTAIIQHLLTKVLPDDGQFECVFYEPHKGNGYPIIFKNGKKIYTEGVEDITIHYNKMEPTQVDLNGI